MPVPVDIVNVFRAPDALPAIAARGGHDRRRKSLVSVLGDQRGGRTNRRGRRRVRRDGSLHQGRTRPLCRTDALAGLQHPAHHVGARRTSVGMRRNRWYGSFRLACGTPGTPLRLATEVAAVHQEQNAPPPARQMASKYKRRILIRVCSLCRIRAQHFHVVGAFVGHGIWHGSA